MNTLRKAISKFCSVSGLLAAILPAICNAHEPTRFEPTIESLQQYVAPDWFRDAKFGIYLHWGVYSVPARGEWYPRRMYREGGGIYKHHVATYGHPSEFGYKDFIPLWKAENFDPDGLVGLFKRAGARYFTPCAVHHDNFDLWDSKHHLWNAAKMIIDSWSTWGNQRSSSREKYCKLKFSQNHIDQKRSSR